jgi:hypothetical protein
MFFAALDLGAAEADEEKIGDGQGRLGRRALDRGRRRAALHDDHEEQSGEPRRQCSAMKGVGSPVKGMAKS